MLYSMTIDEVIQKRYKDLKAMLKHEDTLVISGLTFDDILHDVLFPAIKKMRGKDWDENEAFEELKKKLLLEIFFISKRKSVPIVLLSGDLKLAAPKEPFYENE